MNHIKLTLAQPTALQARPQFHGLPVPYTAFVDAEGRPDFRVTDQARWVEVVSKNLCALCGQKRGKVLWFVGGPLCVQNLLFYDPAMHLECALYAVQACPFIAMGKAYAAEQAVKARHAADAGLSVNTDARASAEPPDRFFLLATRTYKTVLHGSGVYIKLPSRKTVAYNVPKDRSDAQAIAEWVDRIREVEVELLRTSRI